MADEEEVVFAAPVMHGARFDHHALPLDVLKELEAYRRLVVDVARALFLQRHPGRKRVPKGFEGRLELVIRKVEKGSAMPVLLRTARPDTPQAKLPISIDDFEMARDAIFRAVEAATKGNPLPSKFPRAALAGFNNFGRSLRMNESIELRPDKKTAGPHYNRSVRKKLVLQTQKSYLDSVQITGRVFEADVEKRAFHILTDDGKKVAGTFGADHEQVVLTALKSHDSVRVQLSGTGQYDAADHLEKIVEVEDLSVLEEDAVNVDELSERVTQLAQLKNGWLDVGSGTALATAKLDWAHDLLVALHNEEALSLPHLYPTPEGALQAEWSIGDWEVSATFNLNKHSARLAAVHVRSGADADDVVDLDTPEGMLRLVTFVASFGDDE